MKTCSEFSHHVPEGPILWD